MAPLERIIGIGAGGHAKVLIEILEASAQFDLIGFLDQDPSVKELGGYRVLGDDRQLQHYYDQGIRKAMLGLGVVDLSGNRKRAKLYEKVSDMGFELVTLIHPRAIISPKATIGPGSVVMAGAIIGPDVRIGANVVVYSASVIEHDSTVDDHVHLSPGVLLAGSVHIGRESFIGIGAKVIQGVSIGAESCVGAGAVVIRDVRNATTVLGIPAYPMNSKSKSSKKGGHV